MTAEQIEEKIDNISHYVDYIDEQKIRLFVSNIGDVLIPHCYIDELIAVPKSTMRVKICKNEVQSLIGQLKKVDSLFNGNQGFYNSLREDQVAPYMLLYSRLNIDDTKNNYIKLMRLIERTKQKLTHIKKEPAPSGNDTSSKNNLSQLNDNTKKVICQAFNRMDKACRTILDIYGTMSEEEQKAFDLGEAFGDMLNVKNELEQLKAGEKDE